MILALLASLKRRGTWSVLGENIHRVPIFLQVNVAHEQTGLNTDLAALVTWVCFTVSTPLRQIPNAWHLVMLNCAKNGMAKTVKVPIYLL